MCVYDRERERESKNKRASNQANRQLNRNETHRLPKNDTLVTIARNVYIIQWSFVICSNKIATYDEKYFSFAKLSLSLCRYSFTPISLMYLPAFSLTNVMHSSLCENKPTNVHFIWRNSWNTFEYKCTWFSFSSMYLVVNLFAVGTLIRLKGWLMWYDFVCMRVWVCKLLSEHVKILRVCMC